MGRGHRLRVAIARMPAAIRAGCWLVYFLGPPGLLYLLRAMASLEVHRAAPFVPFSFLRCVRRLLPGAGLPDADIRSRVLSMRAGDAERDRDGEPPVVP